MNYDDIISQLEKRIKDICTAQEVEQIRVEYLGKNAIITKEFQSLKNLNVEERKNIGEKLNKTKHKIESIIKQTSLVVERQAIEEKIKNESIDVTLPFRQKEKGGIHIISKVKREVAEIFTSMGFRLAESSELENEQYCFTSLNIPPDHPARQMQDTFYMPGRSDGERVLLRTHTSATQKKKKKKPKKPNTCLL